MDFTVPEFDIERNRDRCTLCGACVKECSYKVHFIPINRIRLIV